MNFPLLFKKIKIFTKKNGVFFVLKRCFGQIVWMPLSLLLKSKYGKTNISKNQILFVSKPDYSDNAFYLFDYLRNNRNCGKYSFVWLIASDDKYYVDEKRVKFYKKNSDWHIGLSREALKAVLTSEYVFFTHTSPFHNLKKRPDQTVVNLWHGCGYKDIKTTKQWEKENPIDYALVPGKVFINTKSHFWACSKDKILDIGYPRYDEFKNITQETKKMLTDLKGDAAKLLIWMPTYRKTELGQFAVSQIKGFFEIPILESEEDLIKLDQYCSEISVVICIKRHQYQLRYKSEDLGLKSIKFIDNNDFDQAGSSLYSLLSCVDGLITDYSSVAIDFLLVDKPIAFALNDFEAYKNTQGFVFENPLDYMPGHHLYNFDDLKSFLLDVAEGKDPYADDRKQVMPLVHNPCNNYCERIWNKIFELSREKE